ncbi:VOC family protein [Micromonospora sp. NPDC000089]|uniref:VOC family protein n=1 Tax=unclassified Micromonospora TaxID=2617518 RepID=UPI00369FD7C3
MIDRSGSQIDHLNIAVPDLTRARAFYEPLLASLDIRPLLDIPANATDPAMTGYGWPDRKPFVWFVDSGTVGTNMHLAFTADTRDQVHAFYAAAQQLDAQLLHPPALHPEYHEHYYGAFILDPHGINLEAVCHTPTT